MATIDRSKAKGKVSAASSYLEDGDQVLNEDQELPIVIGYRARFGPPGLDIRECWYPPGNEELAPTKKGVRISTEDIPEFTTALLKVLTKWTDDDLQVLSDLIEATTQGTEYAYLATGWKDLVE